MPKQANRTAPHSRAFRGPGGAGAGRVLLELPSSGCALPVPELPAGRAWSKPEKDRWTELWESPQATAWDESCRGTVASLIVYESAVWSGAASAWQALELRHAADALGLTPKGMAALGWKIVER